MPTPESIRELLLKVKRLADAGIAGERDAALRKLDALLQKHHLTLDDLAGCAEQEIMVQVRGHLEMELFVQVCAMICRKGTIPIATSKDKRRVWFKCSSRVEGADIEAAFEHYRRLFRQALKEQHEALLHAFINKFHLANPDSDGSGPELSGKDLERLIAAMHALKGEPWAKPRAQLPDLIFIPDEL